MSQMLLFFLLALVPILLWIGFFQWQHHERGKYVLQTFLAGMLSIIPVKLYERYWDTTIFALEHIDLFRHIEALTQVPDAAKLLAFIATSALVAIGFFLFVALVMFLFEVISGDNTIKVFRQKIKKITEAPFFFVSVGVIIGISAFGLSDLLPYHIWFFLIVGILEEFIKHLLVRFSDEEKISSVADAVSFSIVVGLGFAFIENIIYFSRFLETFSGSNTELTIYVLLRSILPVLAHVCFSAILGYFYGLAKFSHQICEEELAQNHLPILRRVHRFFGLEVDGIYHNEKMTEGLLAAMIFHAAFNYLLEMNQIMLAILLVLVLFVWVIRMLHVRRCLQPRRLVRARFRQQFKPIKTPLLITNRTRRS